MTTFLDAVVKVGQYTTQDGKNKNRYQNVGVAMVHTDGTFSVKLESWFNPAGAVNEKGECWINFFAKKDKKQTQNKDYYTEVDPNTGEAFEVPW